MSDKTYPYDPDLPHVVEMNGVMVARTHMPQHAKWLASGYINPPKIIDTTPAPRVPDDAEYIMYPGILSARYFAFRSGVEWGDVFGEFHDSLEDLPGVTSETVFTVLEERKS